MTRATDERPSGNKTETIGEMGDEMPSVSREVRIRVAGVDRGAGTLSVTTSGTFVVAITVVYRAVDGAVSRYAIRWIGDAYEDVESGRRSGTAEELLPLVIRSGSWDIADTM